MRSISWAILGVFGLLLSASAFAEPIQLAKPLIAHWTFDAGGSGLECLDASGNGCDALPTGGRGDALSRVDGLFGKAMLFRGDHMLRADGRPEWGGGPAISLSAWVIPAELSGYREIFRKDDGSNRILFSFQSHGALLSLGLNIGGYVECDATIDPGILLDGAWHHCAATFDGTTMRVYLDGNEVGSRERPGEVKAGGTAPGCIGSSNGGECFQGAMDDLRIYAEALTPDEVAALYRNGADTSVKAREPAPAGEPALDKPILAHWTFNEEGLGNQVSDSAANPPLAAISSHCLVPRRGVHGNALALSGEHAIAIDGLGIDTPPATLSFSAWARPSGLSGNREIFRQENDNRLLFSLQDNGGILSLGLNAGDYAECDARIDPAIIMDGAWHHCAGTFDGSIMRVYLDGKEVGSLERSGALVVSPKTPAFIGSAGGKNEHFQGGLDDVRIYADALTPGEVERLYQGGLDALAAFDAAIKARVDEIYAQSDSFAQTLAHTRKNLLDKNLSFDQEVSDSILARLRKAHRSEYDDFMAWTGSSPLRYLVSKDQTWVEEQVARLVDLLLEYKPLTEAQWAQQTQDDRAKWAEADAIAGQFETLRAQSPQDLNSPQWISIMLEAGKRIQFRPVVREPVAPYIKPETPETRTLSPQEARDALERDWLYQADNNPAPERIASELQWTRELITRLEAQWPNALEPTPYRARLAQLEQKAAQATEPDPQLYFGVRQLKREIMFSNPAVDFDKILLVDMPYPQGSEWRHETRHRLGYMAVPGGRLLILDGLRPGGKVTQLMPQAPLHGSFWRPDLSFDAGKVLFCFKPHNEKSFHLYEINIDGTGLTQLTHGPYDDFDPIYLQDDEHILFSTTRGHTYVRCMPPTNAFVLARCDRDGKNVYLVSANNEPDYLPSLMPDGRVLYTRWEYTDKPLWRAQKLWSINPDGTHVSMVWGNQSVWPDLLKDARCIPGSHRIMFTGSAHHNWFRGSVGIVDPLEGLNFPKGLTKVTADVEWPECGNGPVDPIESPRYHASGAYKGYYSPYPLSEHDFIVSAERDDKFVLYLMDVDGNRELIYEGVNHVLHAMPLKPRPRPALLADRVDWPGPNDRLDPKGGVLYSSNVYQGAPEQLRGKAKYLRILNIEHKTYTYWNKRPYLSTGPVVSAVQSDGVKRILGTVPIEPDGSVAFNAPSGLPLHFQLLDENFRALQTMRSFVGLMPGESRGCLGCHELHSKSPQITGKPVALNRRPHDITPPPWGSETTIGYPRFVQPTLDQYCGKCHQGEGKARKTLDLTERPSSPIFTEPYLTLIGRPSWGAPYKRPDTPPPGFGIADTLLVEAYSTIDPDAYITPEPMTVLSYASRLIDKASSGKHHGVKVDAESLRKLIAWIDTMCPYRGADEVRAIEDPEFQGVDWLAVRPRIQTAPTIIRPGPID